jgi:hypothetical protein
MSCHVLNNEKPSLASESPNRVVSDLGRFAKAAGSGVLTASFEAKEATVIGTATICHSSNFVVLQPSAPYLFWVR